MEIIDSVFRVAERDEPFYRDISGEDFEVAVDDDVPEGYAEKCAEDFNNLPKETLDMIYKAAKAYCLRYRQLAEEGDYLDFFLEEELSYPIDKNTPAHEIMNCIELIQLCISKPKNPEDIGYWISAECDWEPEHGLEILILNRKVVYLSDYPQHSDPWNVEEMLINGVDWNFAHLTDGM